MRFFSDHTSQLTLEGFLQNFKTEEACVDYLYEQKWPDGYCCPRCEERQSSKITTRRLPLYECLHCGHQASLTVGTIMENSSTDLRKWFTALFLVSRQWGISAVELTKRIEVTYKTAWLMLHKVRHAITQDDDRKLLEGKVRVQSAVYGRPSIMYKYHYPNEIPFFVGSSMDQNEQHQYVKMKLLPNNSGTEVHNFHAVKANFAEQQVKTEVTDIEFILGYAKHHLRLFLKSTAKDACQVINFTYRGIGRKHLQAYLNEYCCRLNQSIHDTPLLKHLLTICTHSSSITYNSLCHR